MDSERLEPRLSLDMFGVSVRAPGADELRERLHGGQWLSGAAIGHEFKFVTRVDNGMGLSRLIRHFGVPNSPAFQRWDATFLKGREKTTWEFILLVDERHLFAVYDWKSGISVGYRLVSPRGASVSSRADFEADKETCERFCRYIEAVVNFPPELIDASWR